MIVRRLEDILGTERDVRATTWHSRRLLLRSDGMGFSMHDTVLHAGTSTNMWYRHHLEAVYCIAGEGELEEVESGSIHRIVAGTLYALNAHDRHVLRAHSYLRVIGVVNPPLSGIDVHDATGASPRQET